MIRVDDLEFRYRDGEFVLRVPELIVERGETVAVIGPSGSGKTTLLHLIAGIAVPDAVRVVTGGGGVELNPLDDGTQRDFRVRQIGLVFQEFELLEHLDVLDNILLPYRINWTLRLDTAVRERAAELARGVGIGDKLGRLVGRLSHGERQRAAVCRALVTEPELLLADEPTGNLDPSNKGRVLDILLDYAERTGATLVTLTHDHDLLDRFRRVVDLGQFHELDPQDQEAER